jgi:hypothetical protein
VEPEPLDADPEDAEEPLAGFTTSAAPPPQEVMKKTVKPARQAVRTVTEVFCSGIVEPVPTTLSIEQSQTHQRVATVGQWRLSVLRQGY